MTIGITGSTGFVGREIMKLNDGVRFVPINLRDPKWIDDDFSSFDSILHLAGKAHDMKNENPAQYYEINVDLTSKLIEKCLSSNCPHFIYMSSIKIYGDTVSSIINENSPYNPTDDYGKSKQQAEELLLAESNKISIAIIRPPLIYGPGVKGNMLKLMKLAKKDIYLPFKEMGNARTLVSLSNLSQLIVKIALTKSSGIFLASDGDPKSTSEIIRAIKNAFGINHKLLKIPKVARNLLRLVKPSLYTRLFGNYVLDDSSTRKRLNFTPNHTFEAEIKKMVQAYESKL